MRKLLSLLVLLAFVFCAAVQVQAQTKSSKHWVATWGTSPLLEVENRPPWVAPPPEDEDAPEPLREIAQDDPPPSPIPPVPAELENQTVRMVVRTSVAGEQLRIQFANARGAEPVHLGAVHVAKRTKESSIDPTSDRVVTFGGKTQVTMHSGALVVSDPIDLALPALSEVAVSVYLPNKTATTTKHELGLNTTFISAGNTVAAKSLTEVDTNRSYFWLNGIEVLAPLDTGTIVAFGDSITDGFSTTADAHQAWPTLLAEQLQRNKKTAHLGVVNMGISGNRVLRNIAGSSAVTRFDRDVLARSGVKWIILLQGINDINFSALPGVPESQSTTAAEIIGGLSQLVDRAHAHGIKVMGATLTPMGGLWLHNEKTEAMRREVNQWIRTSGKYDAVVDFDAATRNPESPQHLKPEYNSGDNIHPNDDGNVAMASTIDTSVFQDPGY